MGIRAGRLGGLAAAVLLAGCFRPNVRTVAISVPQMAKESDAERIRKALDLYRALGMVHSVETDISNRLVRVTFDSTMAAVKNLEFLIASAGYDAGETSALRRATDTENVTP